MKARVLDVGGWQRESFGCIVTAREQESGAIRVLHEKGAMREALRVICGLLDALEGDWRILSFSTPATVFRDLQGTRRHESKDLLQLPEHHVLSSIGRRDLLDPAIHPRDPSRGGRAGGLWGGSTTT